MTKSSSQMSKVSPEGGSASGGKSPACRQAGKSSRSGYTFFELITVIAITIIFGSVALLNLPTGLRTKTRIDNAIGNLRSHIALVQQRSMTQENGQQWGIHVDTSVPGNHFYQIFYGNSYETGTIVETIYLPDGIIFLSPTEGTDDDIIFEKVTGRTEDGHSIVIGLADVGGDSQLDEANSQLQSDILEARQNAIDQLNNSNWGTHADSSNPEEHFYQVFYGDTHETGTIVETIYLPDGVLFVSPDNGTADIIYQNGTGDIIIGDDIIIGSDRYNDTNAGNLVIAPGTGISERLASVPSFDASMSLSPSSVTIQAGGSTLVAVTADVISGIPESAVFSISNLPTGATFDFSPVSCTPTCASDLTIQTGLGTPDGLHDIIISITAGGLSRSTTFSLFVNSQSAPDAPENLNATSGDTEINLDWQEPTFTGGATITNYKIYRGLSSGNLTHVADAGISLSYLDSGLNNGTTYYYKVSAVNSVGEGPLSNENAVIPFTCGDALVDSRDGKSYSTVLIGSQCWTAQNINVGTLITGAGDQTDNATIEKYCYSNSEANCTSDGGLYQWAESMQYAASCNGTGEGSEACASPVQGICPAGWHIPSHYEYVKLERAVCTSGTCATDFPYDETTTGWRGTNEGTSLKVSGSSDYSGLLAGFRYLDGSFVNRDLYAHFWVSLEDGGGAWRRSLYSDRTEVSHGTSYKVYGLSVRCLKD